MNDLDLPDPPKGPRRQPHTALLVVPEGLPDEALLEQVKGKAEEASQLRRFAAESEPDPARRANWLEPVHEQALRLWEQQSYAWFFRASRAGIPRLYWLATLDGEAIQTQAIQVTRRFWDEGAGEDGDGLFTCGPTGWKTFAMVAGIRQFSRQHRVAFFPFGRLLRALLDPDQREDILERAIETDAVLIDNLGAAYMKENGFAEQMIEELLTERELHRRVTLATSNLRSAQLLELLGDRVADRLAGAWGRVVEVRGPSLRRQRPDHPARQTLSRVAP